MVWCSSDLATAQWSVAASSVEWGLHRVVALMMELKRRCSDVERGRTEEDRWSHGGGDALIAMKETGVRFLLCFLQFRPWSRAVGSQGERTLRLHQTNVARKKCLPFILFSCIGE